MKKIVNNPVAKQPLIKQVFCSIDGFTVEVCRDRKSLNAAFQVRYKAYLNVGAIAENEEELLYDDFDFSPNSFVHLVWYAGKPVATIRSCVYSDQYDWTPTEGINYFPQEIQKKFSNQTRILESNRFAVDPDFQGRQSLFAQLLLFRAHGLNSAAHNVTSIITAVRSNHIPFYKRFIGMEQLSSDAKYVAWADAEVALMSVSVEDCREVAISRGVPDFDQVQVDNYAFCSGISQMQEIIYKAA